MLSRAAVALTAVAVAAGSVVLAPAPGWATPGSSTATALSLAALSVAADQAAADRVFVRWLAGSDPRSAVRTSAWTALISSRGDAAIADFLATGFAAAKKRAAATSARNADFARRVLATHTLEFSPEVHAAARYALDGTDADRARFVATEYAAAKERDRVARESKGSQAAAIVQADRDFVAGLRVGDPGAQVRAAAAYALRAGAGDGGLVEFFSYDWSSAAGLDLETYRIRIADDNTLWRVTVRKLVIEAQTAQQAAQAASGQDQAAAKAVAAAAWRAVGDQSTPARAAWTQAGEVAAVQAANWQRVSEAAAAAESLNWTVIGDTAQSTREQWASEQATAHTETAFWVALLEQALAGEQAMQPAGTT